MYCFLTTSDIQTCAYGNEKPHCATSADGTKFFSRGKLEAALASGKCVVVITSRPRTALREHDEWWMELVGVHRIHCMPQERGGGGEAFTRFCKEVVEGIYGRPWPTETNWKGDVVPMFWTNALRILNNE